MINKRICLYIGTLSLGGIGKLMIYLMGEFMDKGYEVDLFLMKGGGEYENQVPKGVRIFIEEGSYLGRIRKFISYLNKEKPDVSISARQRQDIGNILGCLLSSNKTKPIISVHTNVTVENELQKNKSKDNVFIKNVSRILYKIPQKFIAVSKGVAEDFSLRTGVSRDMVKVIYNPVYKPYTENKNQNIPEAFKELENKKFIVGVGRLSIQKDFKTLIRAFEIFKRKNEDFSLVILGEGPQRKELEELIIELNLQKNILLLGYVNNPQYYINRANLFVMSSQWEGFGNVIVEALGVGTKVVSTDCPSGPAEILEYGKFGKLVPVGDINAMSEAMSESIRLSESKDFLIERAKDFSIDKIAMQYLNYIFDENHD